MKLAEYAKDILEENDYFEEVCLAYLSSLFGVSSSYPCKPNLNRKQAMRGMSYPPWPRSCCWDWQSPSASWLPSPTLLKFIGHCKLHLSRL